MYYTGFVLLNMSSACDNQGANILVNNKSNEGGTFYVQANEDITVECKCVSSGTPKWTDSNGHDLPNCNSRSSTGICYSNDNDSSYLSRISIPFTDTTKYKCSGVSITIVAQGMV